jgi:hypothetical protein
MRLTILAAIAIGGATYAQSPVSASSRRISTACYASDAYTTHDIAYLREINASSDPDYVRFRERAGLPVVPDSAIQVLADSTKCAQALATYNAEMQGAGALGVYVIRVGPTYVASNPQFRTGEFAQHIVMDSAFVLVGIYLK